VKKTPVWLGLGFLVGSLACSNSSGTGTYKIAFVPSRSGQHGIFVMNSDSRGGKLLTSDPNAQLRPSSWSPDGSKIAFLSFRPGDSKPSSKPRIHSEYPLYVMDAGGINQKRLMDYPVSSFGWSPDSRKLFFISAYENPESDDPAVLSGKENAASAIYILDTQSGDQQRVTSLAKNCFAAWSPDGTRLALSSGTDQETNIFVASTDGKHVRRLTDSSTLNIRPSWSPDGRTIVYLALPSLNGANEETGVFVVDSDGSNKRRVADLICYDAFWSPDGKRLMLQSAAGIYLDDGGGGKPVKLSVGTDRPLDAVFTPDGRQIMFRSNDEGEWHLYTVGLDGKERRRITAQLSAASFCLSPPLSRH
jgi:Tol biopolymer transport system component